MSVSTTQSKFTAPGSSTLLSRDGTICWDYEVTATITVSQDSPAVSFTETGSSGGEYVSTFSGPAQVSSCYSSAIAASSGFFHENGSAGPVCWVGPPDPPGGSGCGFTSTCEQSESCPLILDLNGDGIHTTPLDDPLYFWIDVFGRPEATAWTDPSTEEAFLWLDLNHDRTAQVVELFGSRMVAPDGSYYANGFAALLQFDRPTRGGNGDGQITSKDAVWPHLKLWVDRDHDGVSQPQEISVPGSHRIIALNLTHVEAELYDENDNELYLLSSYATRNPRGDTVLHTMADVEFRYLAN